MTIELIMMVRLVTLNHFKKSAYNNLSDRYIGNFQKYILTSCIIREEI